MKRTILAVFVLGGLGITGYLMAGDGTQKECPLAAAAKAAGAGSCCKGASELAAFPSYQRANELLKSWQEVPAKLAALNENEKSEIQAAAEKMHTLHPGASAMQPTMALLTSGMATLTEIDAAMASMCSAHASTSTRPSDATAKLASAEESEVKCPVAAAALASAHQKMQKSAALVAKANEIVLVAFKPVAEGGCSAKAGCTEATAKLASAEEKPACCAGQTATVAAADAKSGHAVLAAGEAKSEAGCPKVAAAMAAAGEKSFCVKSISAKADAITTQSGAVLAQWQNAGVMLTAMDKADRDAVEKATNTVITRCPMGIRVTESMDVVASLLRDAVALEAQARTEIMKNEEALAKVVPAEAKQLCTARMMTIAAMVNVLDKTNNAMRPAHQVASAQ